MVDDLHYDSPLVGADPYEDANDYRSGMAIAQGEKLNQLIASLAVNIERISNYSPRQLNKEAPENIDMGPLSGKPGAGTAAGVVYQTTQKFRVTSVMYGGGVALDNFRLSVGSRPYNFFGNTGMLWLPFEIAIDRGIDVNVADITTPANVAWSFYIFGYPE